MASYTITLKNDEDFRIIKKLLKAFDGASIIPVRTPKKHLDTIMDEIESGQVVGPFDSVESLMKDLLE